MEEKYYLDTNVIIAYAFEEEVNHEAAVKLLNRLEGQLVTSVFTLLEAATVLSRETRLRYRLPPGTRQATTQTQSRANT